jgi:hypothetical protein
MAVYAVGARTTAAPTSALPAISLYATAAVNFSMLEIGVTNTTAVCTVDSAGSQAPAPSRCADGGQP